MKRIIGSVRRCTEWPRHDAQEVVEQLIESGADVNAMDDANRTALHEAASGGCKDVVEMLIDAGANRHPNGTVGPIADARKAGHQDVVDVLAEGERDDAFRKTQPIIGPNAAKEELRAIRKEDGDIREPNGVRR